MASKFRFLGKVLLAPLACEWTNACSLTVRALKLTLVNSVGVSDKVALLRELLGTEVALE